MKAAESECVIQSVILRVLNLLGGERGRGRGDMAFWQGDMTPPRCNPATLLDDFPGLVSCNLMPNKHEHFSR